MPAAGGLLVGILLVSCAAGSSSRGSGMHRDDGAREEAAGEKSAVVGTLLAIFPGLFVHGMGHRYAGNTERADEILMMEAYSLLTAGLGGGLYAIGESRDAEAVEVAGWIGISAGGAAFLGSWLYDIVFTPSEVEQHNRRVRAQQGRAP